MDRLKVPTSYQKLKMNDQKIIRNNQSSYYGMGGAYNTPNGKKDVKNMTISYEFKNRNEARSKSNSEENINN